MPARSTAESVAALTTPHKPHFALAIATSLGLGYLPLAPGTWGSLAGILLYYAAQHLSVSVHSADGNHSYSGGLIWSLRIGAPIALFIALIGVWAADRAARFLQRKDPGLVVVDEVSGQFLTYLLALAPVNWKYLLLGFILFRVFDIWKPTPAWQAESLPGGLGIMADDWIAGFYAAMGLWIARAAGM